MRNHRTLGTKSMTRSNGGRERESERGQIMIMFTLVVVLLMALAAVVIDVSLLRTDGGKLQNSLDGGALAAGQKLPANNTNVAAITATAVSFSQKNYPGMALGGNPSIPDVQYACLVGIDSNGLPRLTDMPSVCKVNFAANDPLWRCTTAVCWAPCQPDSTKVGYVATDICNTIILYDNVTRQYTFGRAVGVNSGNTGVLSSAACNGVCGSLPLAPVDAVLLLDRTGSMDDSNSVRSLRDGAQSVLEAFDPTLQRIALGFTGPTSDTRTTGGYYGTDNTSRPITGGNAYITSSSQIAQSCTPGNGYSNTVHAISIDPDYHPTGNLPNYIAAYQNANATNGLDDAIQIARPTGVNAVNVGDFLLAAITTDDGGNATVFTPAGWNQIDVTNNGNNVGVTSFWRFATSADTAAGNWTWNLTNNTRAAGIIVRYSGVDTGDPINAEDEDANTGFSTSATVTAPSINTTDGNSALVGVFAANTRNAGFPLQNFTMTGATALTERGDIANTGAVDGPSLAIGTATQAGTGGTGDRTATAASSTRWASQLIALHATPGAADVYGTTYPADLDQWIPVTFTGTDNDAPAVGHREAYVDGANKPVPATSIVHAIGCFDVSQVGTNLATPLQMARQYLRDHGRPGVKQGIILETDGQPEHNPGQNGVGDWNNFTCAASTAAANAVKNPPSNIELFTIGYGVEGQSCPDGGLSATKQLASMATNSTLVNGFDCSNTAQRNTENTDGDHFFCAPQGGDLQGVLRAAAAQLAGGTRLVQLYPTPIVTGVPSPRSAGAAITITGKYFTEAYTVTFGGVNAGSFTVNSDTSITVIVPPGTSGSTVDVQVSTPGGTSLITGSDKFRYN